MTELFYALALLACPVGMGTMMWLMMRGKHTGGESGTASEVAALRAEVARLRAGSDDRRAAGRSRSAG
ncbi:hypothetical protein [Solicola gregarius]|uniref:DUF2933 domain-containing protein n=1 Tax=Solicola gregarius TaxID=2908642 RepID=A0AA46TI83_9ACTN|nr:hypothetical protein [Solicola gregarius]UYM05676.1 hypothetical protein L0C25_00935 [Solicola gregarius]